MVRIGMMQGRLLPPHPGRLQSFPRDEWRREISLAADAGLDSIEWIYDEFGESVNPLATDDGIHEMNRLCEQHGIGVFSVCADYFMDRPFLRVHPADREASQYKLRWLMSRCRMAGIARIVLPFVDHARIESSFEIDIVVETLKAALPAALENGVELHLETSLNPERFAGLLSQLPNPNVRVNYDCGNSAALGYVVREEFAAYGDRIGSVHIKDRKRGGSTVPLCVGDVDFDAVFDGLHRLGYDGDYVLQVARGESGSELAWAKTNRAFVVDRLCHAAPVTDDGHR